MINKQLLHPESIVVVGGSNNTHKPGGAVIRNLIGGNYQGTLRVVNPKEDEVQGIKVFHSVNEIPPTDLAILVIAAKFCPEAVETLAKDKGVKAFIILSAGFGEETHEGAVLEQQILDTCEQYGAALIGPNCIGLMNSWHHSVFTKPIPKLNPKGADFISGSGATAVFILESAVSKGLQFNSVWSIGNGKHIGIESVLEYMDNPFTHSQGMSHCRHQSRVIRKRKPRGIVTYRSHRFERQCGGSPLPQSGNRALLFARRTDNRWVYLYPATTDGKKLRHCHSCGRSWRNADRRTIERRAESSGHQRSVS